MDRKNVFIGLGVVGAVGALWYYHRRRTDPRPVLTLVPPLTDQYGRTSRRHVA